ncbi:MAG: hypothetical protein LC749_03475 [Actinobacteria bacterium]|nr:hypothetical protein [Actinomycetota bacterium]
MSQATSIGEHSTTEENLLRPVKPPFLDELDRSTSRHMYAGRPTGKCRSALVGPMVLTKGNHGNE